MGTICDVQNADNEQTLSNPQEESTQIITPQQSEESLEGEKVCRKKRHRRRMKVDGNNTSSIFAIRPSVLSSDSTSKNFRGLFNLSIILLVITNFRMVVENILKYGILITPSTYTITEWSRWPGLLIGLSLIIYVIAAHTIEVAASKKAISETMAVVLEITNTTSSVVVPSLMVWNIQPHPASGLVVMLFTVTLFMKLVSFSHVNYNLRKETQMEGKDLGWPHNLTWKHTIYFIAVPTLCYQLKYPRNPHIRPFFLLRRALEGVFLSVLLLAIVEQYIVPLVHNSLQPITSIDVFRIFERILKLSIPNLYVWLLGFYIFFHIYMNLIAEILRFGDRLFYQDWWNSTTLSDYWRTWNTPVHNWMLLHVYTPSVNNNIPKTAALLLCFTVSAIFHELVVAVPFQMVKWWSFLGMIGQLPLISITSGLKGNQIGNIIFWFSIVLGQPFLVLMMYRAWYEKHFPFDEIISSSLTVL